MNMFETYTLSILEHLQSFFDNIDAGFQKLQSSGQSDSEKDALLFKDTFE
jgi:hypothetical protein